MDVYFGKLENIFWERVDSHTCSKAGVFVVAALVGVGIADSYRLWLMNIVI